MAKHKFPSGKDNPKYGKGHLIKGKNNPFYGRKHTKKSISKMKGNRLSIEGKNNPMYGKKGKDNPNYGKKRNEKTKALMSKNNYWKGKKIPLKITQKISDNIKKLHESPHSQYNTNWKRKIGMKSKNLWKNKEYRNKVIKNSLKGLLKRPTGLEKKFIKIIKDYNLPYKYIGDGQLIIGGKNPDFIHKKKKIVIEICNSYKAHHPYTYSEERNNHFKKYGYKTMVLWDVLFGYKKLFGINIVHTDIILDLLNKVEV